MASAGRRRGAHPCAGRAGSWAVEPRPPRLGAGRPARGERRGSSGEHLPGALVPPRPGLPARGERRGGGGGGGGGPGEPGRARGGSAGSLRREERPWDRDEGPERDGVGRGWFASAWEADWSEAAKYG